MALRSTFKISIIGCGHVGATAAYALIMTGVPTDLVLFARDKSKAIGEKLDLEHALPFLPKVDIVATNDYEDISGSDLVVVTAGAAQEPGETRLDLAAKNIKVMDDIIPKVVKNAPQAVILIVTNPVDVLTFHAAQLAKLPYGRVFGSGTLLDTARFRFHLSEFLDVNPRSIHTYVLGEHGDSSFPALHSASIGGQPLITYPSFSEDKAREAYAMTRDAAYQVIAGKGATYYAIGTVITHLAQAIQRDSRSVLPVSVPLDDYYGVSDVALSVPCIVGRRGVEQVLKIELSADEHASLMNSANALRELHPK
jgi:L-lactate dehydrogenase